MFVGQEWASCQECRDYIKDQNIFQNFDIVQVKNTEIQQQYKCKDPNCKWNVYCSRIWDKVPFRCKKGDFEHTCKTTHGINNPLAKARVMLDAFKVHPNYKPKDFKSEVKRVHSVEISYWTAWHAWHMCMERFFGNYEESYALSPECCEQILKRNDGSIASCATDEAGKFKHLCIAYKCSLEGFRLGCRPILGLDGCFLKGKYGGVCLSIMSLDANNGLFPIAIFICRKENKENWTEFLRIVAPCLKLHPRALTFISDREKGLISAVDTNFADVNHYHRYCFRHMYKNMKRYHPGKHLEALAWNAARSYVKEDHDIEMKKMMDVRPKRWLISEREDSAPVGKGFL
ncbi:hypothetical protein MKW92_038167 [Papaver armeniacum]|nr:hypothetical protein MKW92_038167 [Papaver armeniacum]